MNKLVFALTVVAALAAGSTAMARNVSADEARTAAAAYLRINTPYTDLRADDLTLVRQAENKELGVPAGYFFNAADWGFIIMTGSTAMDAVVGYSTCGNLDPENLPDPMADWVEGWLNAARDVQLMDRERAFDDTDEWTLLLSGTELPARKDDNDVILMNEAWDQGTNAGTDYNMFCPVVNGKRCYVGCVATALAQIVHYYRFPVQPRNRKSYTTGTHHLSLEVQYDTVRFDYSLMPNRIASSTTQEKRREVSKLGYMIGVAVKMDYTPDGSGAHSTDVPAAMQNYFRYNRGTMYYRRSSFPHEVAGTNSSGQTLYYDDYLNYSPYNNAIDDSTYLAKMRAELMSNRPVYMGGVSSSGGSSRDAAGHAFVVCGYRPGDQNMYYFNWGWGGTCNGWYNAGGNNMPLSGGMGNYNRVQEIIVGIVPPNADSTEIDFLGIRDVEPVQVELEPAYPNPAAYSVNIPYTLGSAADLFIYSMDGRLVERRRLEAGEGEAEVRVDALPAGLYIYRLGGMSGKFVVTQ